MSKVGVYSAVYNCEKYVQEMIESIQAQTFQDWELSMVDDGSSDNSLAVVQEAIKSDDRISIIQIPHCGIVGKVKNKAISLLKGNPEYICGVDSDDYIIPETLEIYTKFLDERPEVGAACGNFLCFDDTTRNEWALNHVAQSGEYSSETLLQYMNFFPLRFYRKVIHDIVGGYSETLTNADDFDLALKIDEVTTIKRIKEPVVYYYRQHGTQISSTLKDKENSNAKLALEDALKRRGIDKKVINDAPPFKLQEKRARRHFIWGKE